MAACIFLNCAISRASNERIFPSCQDRFPALGKNAEERLRDFPYGTAGPRFRCRPDADGRPCIAIFAEAFFHRRPGDAVGDFLATAAAGVLTPCAVERLAVDGLGRRRQMMANRSRQIGVRAVRHAPSLPNGSRMADFAGRYREHLDPDQDRQRVTGTKSNVTSGAPRIVQPDFLAKRAHQPLGLMLPSTSWQVPAAFGWAPAM